MDGGLGHPRLTGRDDEFRRLQRHLDALLSGRGSLVFVAGEPGIGKTRLVCELASACEAAGVAVGWGRCPEDGAGSAFRPWVSALREGAGTDLVALAEQGGGGPATTAQRTDAPLAESRRFGFFEDVTRQLLGAGPLMVVLDDVDRADEASVALLRHVADALPVLPLLVVATLRDIDRAGSRLLRGLLLSVVDDPACDYVELLPLPAEATIECARAVEGRRLDPERLIAVVARSGGNPFFISELVRATTAGVSWSLPRTVHEVLRARLAELEADVRRVLDALAVLGGEAAEALLAGLLSTTAEALVSLLAPAIEARLVECGNRSVRFPHALVGEVVLIDLEPAAGAVLHRRAVAVLAQAVGSGAVGLEAGPRAESMAQHALAAEAAGQDIDAADHVLEAGRYCERCLAFENAADLYGRALAVPSGRSRQGALRRARREALVRAGLLEDGDGAADEEADGVTRAAAVAVREGPDQPAP